MISVKKFNADGKIYKFKSDFPITSELNGRLLFSDDDITYTDVESSLWYIDNDTFIFYNETDTQTEGNYVKIIVATNPDELYSIEIDEQLSELTDTLTSSENLSNNVETNVILIKEINDNIENIYNNILNIKEDINNKVNLTTNYLTTSQNLVDESNENKTYLDNKITYIDNAETNANDILNQYNTAITEYDTKIGNIDSKLVELEAYKTALDSDVSLITSAAEDAESAKNLALQYKNESITVINQADIDITEIEQSVTDTQELESNCASYVATANGSATDAANYASEASEYITQIETSAVDAATYKEDAVSAAVAAAGYLQTAQELATGSIINDSVASLNSVYSSAQIEYLISDLPNRIIKDNVISETSTYSSYKIENSFETLKFNSLQSYSTPSLVDYLHIYNYSSGTYNKVLVENLQELFTNPNYSFNNLDELNSVPDSEDYFYIYQNSTSTYKKIKAEKVIDYSTSSTLYNFSDEQEIGSDGLGNKVYRKSITYTEVAGLDNNFTLTSQVIDGSIINLECVVINTNNLNMKSISCSANKNGNNYNLVSELINVERYDKIIFYVDYTR